jgi:hypothetical protein
VHVERARRLRGLECERAASRLIILTGNSRSVRGGVVDRYSFCARRRERDRETGLDNSGVPLRDGYVVDRELRERVVGSRDRRLTDIGTAAIRRGRRERRSEDDCQDEEEEAMHHLLRGQEKEGNQDEHPDAQPREVLSPRLERAHRPSPRQGARGSDGEDQEYEWGEEQEREGQDSGCP